jgi:hypothetical protein
VFQTTSCLLRRIFNRDSKFHAIPAGLLAGLAFGFFPDNTIALYVMWKSLQVSIATVFLRDMYMGSCPCVWPPPPPCVPNVLPMSHLDLKNTSYVVPLFSHTLSLNDTYKVNSLESLEPEICLNYQHKGSVRTSMEIHCCLLWESYDKQGAEFPNVKPDGTYSYQCDSEG